MKRFIGLLWLLMSWGSNSLAAVNEWSSTGPEGGAVWYAEYLTNSSGVAIATSGNSIYRTTDNGANWTAVRTGMIVGTHVPIVLDPSNPARVVVLGANQYLLTSDDGGQTFTPGQHFGQAPTNYETAGAISADGLVWYGGTLRGEIYRSTDHGTTWELRSNGLPIGTSSQGATKILVDPRNHDRLYAVIASTSPYSLFFSDDGGQSWSVRSTQICSSSVGCGVIAINPAAPDQLLAATQGGMYLSTTAGVGWARRDSRQFLTVRFDPSTPNRAYAATSNNELVTTNDGGLTWSSSTPFLIGNNASFAFDSLHPGRILLSTQDGAFISDDAGQTWASKINGIRGADVTRIFSRPATTTSPAKTYALATSGAPGVYVYNSMSQSWSQLGRSSLLAQSPTLRVAAMALDPNDGQVVYAGGVTGGFFRSADGGMTWSKPTPSLDADWINDIVISSKNSQQVFVTTQTIGRSFLSSIDGGLNFLPHINGLVSANRLALDSRTPSTLYSYSSDTTSGSSIEKTIDAGLSWNSASTGLGGAGAQRVVVDPSNSEVVYAATANGLYKSTNGAASWAPIADNSYDIDVAVDERNPSQLLRISRGLPYQLYRSVDGGASWEGIQSTGLLWSVAFNYASPGSIMASVDRSGVASIQIAPDLSVTSASTSIVASTAQAVTLAVRNNGPYAASQTSLQVSIPITGATAHTSRGSCAVNGASGHVTCSLGMLRVLESATVTITLPGLSGGQVTANIAAIEPDTSQSNNSLVLSVNQTPPSSSSSSSAASSTSSASSPSSTLGGSSGGGGLLDPLFLSALSMLLVANSISRDRATSVMHWWRHPDRQGTVRYRRVSGLGRSRKSKFLSIKARR